MKLQAIVFTALVALATVNGHYLPDFGKGQLHEDIQYFLDFIPMEKVAEIVMQYAAEDAEFQNLLDYFQSTEFKNMLAEVEAIPSFRVFADYLQDNGVYIYNVLNQLNKVVGIPPFHTLAGKQQITGGLKGLFEDVKHLVNYDDFIRGYVYKMRVSDAFRAFVAHLKSPNHQQFVNDLYSNTKFLFFRGRLARSGIDVVLIEDILYVVLGIEFPIFEMPVLKSDTTTELSRDLHDFVDLIDMGKITEIVLSYLDDDEVHTAVNYLQSEDFHVLVRKVEAMHEYQDLVRYLEDAGLDMKKLLQNIHKLFNMEDYVPPKANYKQYSISQTYVNKGGLKALVRDVKAALPLAKWRALYEDKMQHSPAFKIFMGKLRSPDFQNIVNLVYKTPIFLEMRQKVIDTGIDLTPIKEIIEDLLGIHLPTVPIDADWYYHGLAIIHSGLIKRKL